MIRVFIRHRVADYQAWKKAYDSFEEARNQMGVRGHALFQGAEDPNDVTAWHDFDDLEAARAFTGSARLEEAMKQAGVVGAPTVWFTTGV